MPLTRLRRSLLRRDPKNSQKSRSLKVMELVPAIASADSDRYIGCQEPCTTSHASLEFATNVQGKVRTPPAVWRRR